MQSTFDAGITDQFLENLGGTPGLASMSTVLVLVVIVVALTITIIALKLKHNKVSIST